jgi:hypothetical protein
VNKNQKGIIHFLLILGIAIIALSLIGFNLYKSGRILTTLPQVTSPTPNEEMDETASWKTYNSRLGYSVRFPSDWFATLDPAIVDGDIIYNLQEFYEVRSGENQSNSGLSSLIVIGIEKFELPQLGLNPQSTPEQVAQALDGKTANVFEQKTITVDDRPAIYRDIEIMKERRVNVYVPFNDVAYVLSLASESFGDNDKKQFDQILSTFRFLDSNLNEICEENEGAWIAEYNECESSVSDEGIDEELCTSLGGTYDNCASNVGCRHEDSDIECLPMAKCIKLCKF